MQEYGKQKSAVKPSPIIFDEYSVWIYSDIQQVEEDEYEFNLTQYDKNEYILKLRADVDFISIMSEVLL